MLTALLAGCQENKSNSEEESGLGAVSVDKVTVYTTAKDTDKRLTITDQLTFEPGVQPYENEVSVFVNPNKRYQKVLGFGGAITDASSEVFAKLSQEKQEELIFYIEIMIWKSEYSKFFYASSREYSVNTV